MKTLALQVGQEVRFCVIKIFSFRLIHFCLNNNIFLLNDEQSGLGKLGIKTNFAQAKFSLSVGFIGFINDISLSNVEQVDGGKQDMKINFA